MGGGPESIPVRLARGETADILILNRPPLDELTDAGHIRPESRVDLVRSVIGMAVRSGAPKPDISTREGSHRDVAGRDRLWVWLFFVGHPEGFCERHGKSYLTRRRRGEEGGGGGSVTGGTVPSV